MSARHPAYTLTALAALGLVPILSACTSTESASGATRINVASSDSACDVDQSEVSAGANTLAVTNTGSKVTEVYVYGAEDRIISERENIGPGTSADLTVDLQPGDYQVACKPGQIGDGIRQPLKVTGTATTVDSSSPEAKAVADYRAYVTTQVDASLTKTREFVDAVKAGDVATAKELYAPSRVGWESVEPVAESFGDIDPRIDLREADLEEGQKWTGWHRIEKSLWVNNSTKGMEPFADQLMADLEELKRMLPEAQLTVTSMGNGAKELLDEVATGKITGEEELFSHTDLWDFDANVDGARKAYDLLRPIAENNDPELVTEIDAAFTRVEESLAPYRTADGFVSYDTVTEPQRKVLSDAVNGLAEPLSHLAAAVAPR